MGRPRLRLALGAALPIALAALASATVAAGAEGGHPRIPDDAEFHAGETVSGVAFERATPEGLAHPFVRGTETVDAPCAQVRDVLTSFDRYAALFSGVVRTATVLAKTDSSARVHFVYAFPWPLRDRDAIVGYSVSAAGAGGFTLEWHDDARAGDPAKGVRITHVEGRTRMAPDGASCRVAYTYYGELGIDLGKSFAEKEYREEPIAYFEAIRKGLRTPPGQGR
ncbi:MAG TPA: hypothetical protein VMV18_08845 [bacterium]|nr:hypothetical protein [bacterium]